jgi:hypothetical protein
MKFLVSASLALAVVSPVAGTLAQTQRVPPVPPAVNMPYADARPILAALRAELLPAELRDRTPAELESAWPAWLSRSDTETRARLARGDDDSIVNWLLFGVTFTARPRITQPDMDAGLANTAEIVQGRIADMVAGVASADANERLQFVRGVLQRKGIDPKTMAGRSAMRRYLNEEVTRFLGERQALKERAAAAFTRASNDPGGGVPELRTLFHDRGLSSDTTMNVDFALERALDAIKSKGLLGPGSIRRVAIVGPGLDFTDKSEGYDFYPLQTIQPFAVIDSLIRLGLAKPDDVRMTTLDLSPRINEHLEAARRRALAGGAYVVELPLDTTYRWNPQLVAYWKRFGDTIKDERAARGAPAGKKEEAALPVANAAPPGVQARAVRIRPAIIESITPRDVNLVVQRIEPLAAGERFDLIVATNILVYYNVFEQSLALANVAKMLRPGGFFLLNGPVFELPGTPIHSAGYTDVVYSPGRNTGLERIFWYEKELGR